MFLGFPNLGRRIRRGHHVETARKTDETDKTDETNAADEARGRTVRSFSACQLLFRSHIGRHNGLETTTRNLVVGGSDLSNPTKVQRDTIRDHFILADAFRSRTRFFRITERFETRSLRSLLRLRNHR